jgi:heat shock protein HslJ
MAVFCRIAAIAVVVFGLTSTHGHAGEPTSAPGLADLAQATYHGISPDGSPISLIDGEWRGQPYIEGGATMPWAGLVGELVVKADVNLDGRFESINLVEYSGGGTGHFVYLAISRFGQAAVENIASTRLGDRVMVRDIRVDDGVILVDLVQAGDGDGACCPGDLVTRAWRLQAGVLVELEPVGEVVRLSPAALAGDEWRLVRWGHDEPVDGGLNISLAWSDGRFTGRSACNRYFAGVRAGEGAASSLVVEGVGSTRMACVDEPHAAAEARFLGALEQVNRLYFLAGDLVLHWGEGEDFGALYFRRTPPADGIGGA